MKPTLQKGYLILADISGFTAFMEHGELEHAPFVLNHLINFLTDELTPTLHLAEVEGDAVFVYADEDEISRREFLMELLEATYMNFRDRRMTMAHNITCPCRACRSVSTLDLKFVVHYGEYVLQEIAGKMKPYGSCVNLAHHLLKNSITRETGWKGYALFSKKCIEKMGLSPENPHASMETYNTFGTVETLSTNLHAQYRRFIDTRRVLVEQRDADVSISHQFRAPPPVVWDWLNDPAKRNRWSYKSNWVRLERPSGRTGIAAKNHCTASNMIEEILDWRPFDYNTTRLKKGMLDIRLTNILTNTGTGTHLRWNVRMEGALPRWFLRIVCRFIVHRILKVREGFGTMAQLMHSMPV